MQKVILERDGEEYKLVTEFNHEGVEFIVIYDEEMDRFHIFKRSNVSIKKKGWINIWSNGAATGLYYSKESADAAGYLTGDMRIDCIEVEYNG